MLALRVESTLEDPIGTAAARSQRATHAWIAGGDAGQREFGRVGNAIAVGIRRIRVRADDVLEAMCAPRLSAASRSAKPQSECYLDRLRRLLAGAEADAERGPRKDQKANTSKASARMGSVHPEAVGTEMAGDEAAEAVKETMPTFIVTGVPENGSSYMRSNVS